MLVHLLLVSIGGFFGSMSRFWLSNEFNKHFTGTWLANISGSILLALLFRLYIHGIVSESIWLILGVGFAGAYTTFSTFGKETFTLLLERNYLNAALYIISSFLVSFILVAFIVIW